MIDILCLVVVGVVTWLVAGEGIWGAAQTFLCTLLSALIAMNLFEPLAARLRSVLPEMYCDFVALIGLFIALAFVLRMGSEYLAPSYIQVVPALDTFGRWVMGAITGYLTMAFLLTSIHTAPLPREFLGFTPERNNFFGVAPDRQWLGFVQYVSEKPLGWVYLQKAGLKTYLVTNSFDGRFEVVGDPARPYTTRDSYGRDVEQVIWPSFPIRYATRRLQYQFGQSVTQTPAPIQTAPSAAGAGPGRRTDSDPNF